MAMGGIRTPATMTSHFSRRVEFPDYASEELVTIVRRHAAVSGSSGEGTWPDRCAEPVGGL
ncbi:hypothetical protein [Streptomyces sp. NPDC020298]|uniref:hypothetical protein n=1 Tax=unclassified Streptomyces TaxID=2593676 RepID=UPI0033C27AB9